MIWMATQKEDVPMLPCPLWVVEVGYPVLGSTQTGWWTIFMCRN